MVKLYNSTEQVWIGIGSNLLNPKNQVNQAIWALSRLPDTVLVACSSYYCSIPMGKLDQPNFLNMVVILDTKLAPEVLLDYMQYIEQTQGRVRNEFRWYPRTLDLDILLFGNYIIHTSRLIVPHYDMQNRSFVVYPMIELDSNLILPSGCMITNIVKIIPKNGLSFWSK